MSKMPVFDGDGNAILSKKKGPGRPKKVKDPVKKPKTQFTFYEYLVKRLDLSYIAGMFKEGSATVLEWDLMVKTLNNLLQNKIESGL